MTPPHIPVLSPPLYHPPPPSHSCPGSPSYHPCIPFYILVPQPSYSITPLLPSQYCPQRTHTLLYIPVPFYVAHPLLQTPIISPPLYHLQLPPYPSQG